MHLACCVEGFPDLKSSATIFVRHNCDALRTVPGLLGFHVDGPRHALKGAAAKTCIGPSTPCLEQLALGLVQRNAAPLRFGCATIIDQCRASTPTMNAENVLEL